MRPALVARRSGSHTPRRPVSMHSFHALTSEHMVPAERYQPSWTLALASSLTGATSASTQRTDAHEHIHVVRAHGTTTCWPHHVALATVKSSRSHSGRALSLGRLSQSAFLGSLPRAEDTDHGARLRRVKQRSVHQSGVAQAQYWEIRSTAACKCAMGAVRVRACAVAAGGVSPWRNRRCRLAHRLTQLLQSVRVAQSC